MASRGRREGTDRTEELVEVGAARGTGAPSTRLPADLAPRPRDVGETLDLAIDVLRLRFLACTAPAFLFWLPGAWLQARILRLPAAQQAEVLIPWMAVVLAVSTLVSAFVGALSVGFVSGRRRSAAAVAARFVTRLPSLLVIVLVRALAIGAGVFTCGVLSVVFWWRFLFADVAVLVGPASPLHALRWSWRLTRTGFLRWMGLFLLVNALVVPFHWASSSFDDGSAQAFLRGVLPGVGSRALDALAIACQSLLNSVPAALNALAVALAFVDARVRAEAWDLELALGERERAQPRRGGLAAAGSSP